MHKEDKALRSKEHKLSYQYTISFSQILIGEKICSICRICENNRNLCFFKTL